MNGLIDNMQVPPYRYITKLVFLLEDHIMLGIAVSDWYRAPVTNINIRQHILGGAEPYNLCDSPAPCMLLLDLPVIIMPRRQSYVHGWTSQYTRPLL